MSPKVSVVMAVYQGERYLEQAIDSVLSQTLTDFEFIIVDDCSTDSTPEILRRYAERDSRIRLLRNAERVRQGESANRGIAVATGEFIARQDADDASFSTRLEKQVAFMEKHPKVTLCGTHAYIIDADSKPVTPQHLILNAEKLYAELQLKRCWITNGSTMFRRSEGINYRGKFICEDMDLFIQLFQQDKLISIMPDCLYQYRLSRSHLTSARKLEQDFHSQFCVECYRRMAETGEDDYAAWDPESELARMQNQEGGNPVLVDAEFNYRRGLLFQFFSHKVYGSAMGHALYLLTHFPPWKMGLRWLGICLFVLAKGAVCLPLGFSRRAGFDWPEE